MPPPWIRRPVTITLWLVASLAGLVLSPLLVGVGAIASALTRRPQPLILARVIAAYCPRELAALCACGGLWLASGGGILMQTRRFQELHWGLLRWFLHGITNRALSLLDIAIDPVLAPGVARALEADTPLIVFSRHAGPGDSILLIDQLLAHFDRRPSVVLKQEVVAEPCVDLLAHRLPHAVLDTSDRQQSEARIAAIAAELDERGVMVLFPEGGNFTPQRRRSAILHLRRRDQRRAATQAERRHHVLPPRPAGALAALRGNPTANVIFAAHTGLGLAVYPRQLWNDPPIGRTLHTRMWLVPAGEIPTDPDSQVEWLNDWWNQIDDWIDQRGREALSARAGGASSVPSAKDSTPPPAPV